MTEWETQVVDTDLLIVGGGMSACGAATEAAYWAKKNGLKVTVVDKAAMDRSGAVAMGLSAINEYIGIEEGDPVPRRFLDAAVARRGRPLVVLPDIAHIVAQPPDGLRGGIGGAIIHDDDLRHRTGLFPYATDGGRQELGGIVGRYHCADRKLLLVPRHLESLSGYSTLVSAGVRAGEGTVTIC